MLKDLTALEELLSIVEDETGVNDNCADEPDGEPVGWREDGPLPMTFGHVRRARAELDAWKSS